MPENAFNVKGTHTKTLIIEKKTVSSYGIPLSYLVCSCKCGNVAKLGELDNNVLAS